MRIIPVLDLAAGRAVHARGGDRALYPPLRSALAPDSPGDPLAVARALVELSGGRAVELYVADLDAITGGAPQRAIVRALANAGAALLLDAAITDISAAERALADGASHAVVGLETLRDFADLDEIVGSCGAARVAASLDLRDGAPLGVAAAGMDALEAAERAGASGAGTLIVLDLTRVGAGGGLDLSLLTAVRRALPGIELLAGGGVRGDEDLARLADVGCDGALVGSALHEGRIAAGARVTHP